MDKTPDEPPFLIHAPLGLRDLSPGPVFHCTLFVFCEFLKQCFLFCQTLTSSVCHADNALHLFIYF